MRLRDELTIIAETNGWTAYDTGPRSVTFGIQDVACIHVRFTARGSIHNAIYVVWGQNANQDQYVLYPEGNKAQKIEDVLVGQGAASLT